MTDPRRQRFAPYLRHLADMMGLRDWRVEIEDDDPGEDHLASVCCVYGQRQAIVRLGDRFLDKPPDRQRWCLVHELNHCHLEPAWQIAEDGMPESTRPAFRRIAEYANDAIAEAWAVHLPMPPGPDEPAP